MGLDGLDMAIAIGANCTFRRSALDSINGHAVHLAEDCCTSMRIHAAGWKGRYVPYRASYGLVPEDLQTFFKQQIKWSKGMFDLLFREYPSLFAKFNIQQKIYYLFAGTFFLGGAVNLLTIILPIVFLFFQIYAIEMPVTGYFMHIIPYMLTSLVLSFYIQRWYSDRKEHGFPWRSMFLEKGTWHIYTLGLYYSLTGKAVAWLPTPKTGAGKTGIGLLLPHIIAIVLSAAAIVYPFLAYHRLDNGTALMMVFAAMNVVTLAPTVLWGLRGNRSRA
jgi:cellulose synthase (UDP-forming)